MISKEVKITELYKYALTLALQTKFIIPEEILNEIHLKIINELKSKCKPLAEQGIISKEDISNKLDYDVASFLVHANKENLKRVFNLVSEDIRLDNCGYIYRIVDGQHNCKILSDIREWFRQSNGIFFYISESVKNEMLDDIEDQLKIEKLFPKIFEERVSIIKSSSEGLYTYVLTIDVNLQIHDFNFSKPTKYRKLRTHTVNCYIDKESGIKRIINGNGNLAFCFPLCERCEVNIRFDADVVFNVTQELWHTFLSSYQGQKLKKTIVHRVRLDMNIPDSNIKLVKAITIKTSEEKAGYFRRMYEHFKEIVSSKAKLPGASFLSMLSRFPWLEIIETLRKGSVDAAMEIMRKKPDLILSLLNNQNCVLGVTFEELQFSIRLAEIIKGNIPVEVIPGDGRGSINYMNKVITTPEYTDVVLRNTVTGELFCIQYKFSTNGENVVRNTEMWIEKWIAKYVPHNSKLPDACKLENTKVIVPEDVMKELSFRNIDTKTRHHFYLEEPSWAKCPVDNTETIKAFLNDNKDLLVKIVASEEFKRSRSLNIEIKNTNEKCEKCKINIIKAKKKIRDLLCKQNATGIKQKTTEDLGKEIRAKERQIDNWGRDINRYKSELQSKSNEMAAVKENMRSNIHKNINLKYREPYLKSGVLKDVQLNVVVQAVTDGLVALICTCGRELEKLKKNEISFTELIVTVTKETVMAFSKGTLFASTFIAIRLAATYATACKLYSGVFLTAASKSVFPMYILFTILKQSYDIICYWRKGDLTNVEMKKSFLQIFTSIGLNALVGIGSSFIGGPMGLVVGAGFAIVVNVGDYFLGNKFWNLFLKDDNGDESLESKEDKIKNFQNDVVRAAYDFFRLTEQASMEEIKEKYKAAVLKCHPDKGGDNESFCAVRASYLVICEAKGFKKDKEDHQYTN